MLVLNGSKAFATLMKGQLVDPPSKTIAEDPDSSMQWVLHNVVIMNKNCVIAMELQTRYSMIFIDEKDADLSTFIPRFILRLVTEMSILFDMPFSQLETHMEQFIKKHPQTLVCQRNDRSVQSHINDVVWNLENHCHEMGTLPVDMDELMNLEVFINQLLRSVKGSKDYFHPYEKMKALWQQQFPDLSQESATSSSLEEYFEHRDERADKYVSSASYNKSTLH